MTRSAFDLAAGVPWAIYQPALQIILEIADRAEVNAAGLAEWKAKMRPSALALGGGTALREGSRVTVRDGVAVLAIDGPIFRYANLFTEISGAVTLELLARDFAEAVAAREVRAVVLAIDSPGGEVTSIAEFADAIRAASAIKPVVGFADGLAASGAYWIASAAGELVVARTALLGAIGVVTTIVDRDPPAGVRRFEIVSSQSPDKRIDVATSEGRGKIQALVDRIAAEFVAAVAAFRKVSADQVMSDFGRGGLVVGADAVAAGMADRVGSFEEVLAGLAQSRPGQSGKSLVLASKQKGKAMNDDMEPTEDAVASTTKQLASQYPALVEAIQAEARAVGLAAGARAERERIQAIEKVALPGHEALIAAAKADGKSSAGDVAQAIVAAEKISGTKALAAAAADDLAVAGAKPALTSIGAGAEKRSARDLAVAATAVVAEEAAKGNVISVAAAMARVIRGQAAA